MSMYDKNISSEKRASLEFAEEQREAEWKSPSFAKEIFQGHVDWKLIHPFPAQPEAEKREGDAYIAKLKDFLIKNLNPDEVDRNYLIPDHVMKGLGELKAFAIKIPKEYGGLGFTQVNYNRVMHMVASYCGSTAVLLSAHQSIGVPQPLKLFGTEEQKKKYFPMFVRGAVSAFALTEPTVGSDPRQMLTTATPTDDGKHFLINGDKLWCTNGLVAEVIVVMAVTPPKIVKGKERKQITAFIVETNSPGFEIVHRCQFLGLHGIQNGLVRFKNVKVPKENIILAEGEGLRLALTTLNTGRLTLPAASVGIGKWCMSVARQWSNEREQWGAKIGQHESVALKLAFISSYTYAMEAMTWLVSNMADDKHKDIRLEAAIAKYFCTHQAWKTVDETLQIRGGQGYESADSLRGRGAHPWAVERVLRDARINTIIEGTSEIMHLFIAREALDPHLSKMMPVLMGKGIGAKLKGLVNMIAGYALWYPSLYLPSFFTAEKMDNRLLPYAEYVQSASKRLALYVFHQMAKYQKKMEAKQAILNRAVDIGVELFAISCVLSYTDHLLKNEKDKVGALHLAEAYCQTAQNEIERIFHETNSNQDKIKISLSKKFLAGEMTWLEDNIIV